MMSYFEEKKSVIRMKFAYKQFCFYRYRIQRLLTRFGVFAHFSNTASVSATTDRSFKNVFGAKCPIIGGCTTVAVP